MFINLFNTYPYNLKLTKLHIIMSQSDLIEDLIGRVKELDVRGMKGLFDKLDLVLMKDRLWEIRHFYN